MLFSYLAVFLLPQQHSQVQTNRSYESILYQLWPPQKICAVEKNQLNKNRFSLWRGNWDKNVIETSLMPLDH